MERAHFSSPPRWPFWQLRSSRGQFGAAGRSWWERLRGEGSKQVRPAGKQDAPEPRSPPAGPTASLVGPVFPTASWRLEEWARSPWEQSEPPAGGSGALPPALSQPWHRQGPPGAVLVLQHQVGFAWQGPRRAHMPLLEFWGGGAGSAGLVLALLGVCLLPSLLWEKSRKPPRCVPHPSDGAITESSCWEEPFKKNPSGSPNRPDLPGPITKPRPRVL